MNSDRRNAIIAGILFLVGFSGVVIVALTNPLLNDAGFLVKASEHANQMAGGAFFQLTMAFACAGIAVFLFPVLRKQDEALALGAVGFRIIEGALFVLSALGLLSLISLSREYIDAGMPAASWFQALGALILASREWASQVLGIIAWSLGAFMYHYVFFRSRLIPRWLSAWGLVGAPLAVASSLLVVFQIVPLASTVQVVLNLPLGLQEIPLAVWLIVKGFNPSASVSGSVKPGSD